METNSAVNTFKEKVYANPNGFLKLINDLKDSYRHITLYERKPTSPRQPQYAYSWYDVITVYLDYLSNINDLKYLINLLDRIKYPVVRLYTLKLSITDDALYDKDLPKMIAQEIIATQKFYEFARN